MKYRIKKIEYNHGRDTQFEIQKSFLGLFWKSYKVPIGVNVHHISDGYDTISLHEEQYIVTKPLCLYDEKTAEQVLEWLSTNKNNHIADHAYYTRLIDKSRKLYLISDSQKKVDLMEAIYKHEQYLNKVKSITYKKFNKKTKK